MSDSIIFEISILQSFPGQYYISDIHIYRDVLIFVDQFMGLCFTATGSPPAVRRI
jgi:hypothetical protein